MEEHTMLVWAAILVVLAILLHHHRKDAGLSPSQETSLDAETEDDMCIW